MAKGQGGQTPYQRYLAGKQGPSLTPYQRHLAEQDEEDKPGLLGSVAGRLGGVGSTLKDVGTQALRGTAEFATSVVRRAGGVADAMARNAPTGYGPDSLMREADLPAPKLPEGAETPVTRFGEYLKTGLEETPQEPKTTAGLVTRFAVPMLAEGAGYVAGGGPIRAGIGKALPSLAGKIAGATSKLGRVGGSVASAGLDAASVAPLDIATSFTPDQTAAGAAAAVLSTPKGREIADKIGLIPSPETLQEWSESPAKAALFEAAFGFGADLAFRGLAGAVRAPFRALDVSGDVAAGVREGTDLPRQAWEAPRIPEPTPKNMAGLLPDRLPEPDVGGERAAELAAANLRAQEQAGRRLTESDLQHAKRAGAEAVTPERADVEVPESTVADEVVERSATEDETLLQTPDAPKPEPTRIQKYRETYDALETPDLIERYHKIVRGLAKTGPPDEAVTRKRASVGRNTYGDKVPGQSEFGWRTVGRHTQQTDRVDVIEDVLRSRGVDPGDLPDPYAAIRPRDVMEENAEIAAMLPEASDDDLVREFAEAEQLWSKNREDSVANERMAVLWAEAEKRGRGVQDRLASEMGAALPEVARALFGTGAGALIGAGVDREMPGRGALAGGLAGLALSTGGARGRGGFAAGGGPTDLFGQPVRPTGPAQRNLLPEPGGPQGMSAALDNARAVVSSLEGKVERGAASMSDTRRYEEARSLLRRAEGRGLDETEVRARRRDQGTEEADPFTGDLFGESGAALPETTRALAGGIAGAATGAAVDDESPGGGALVGAGLGAAAGLAPGAIRRRAKPDEDLSPAVAKVAATIGKGANKPKTPLLDRVKGFGRWLRYKASRESGPFEHFEREVGGAESDAVKNAMARMRGWIPSASVHMEQSLGPAIRDAGESPKKVNALLKAQRGLELAEFGKETTPEQLADWQAVVEELSGDPKVTAVVDRLRGYYRTLWDMKKDAGLITEPEWQAAIDKGQAYIPFLPSDVAEFRPGGPGGGRYEPNRSAGVRRMSDALNEAITVDPIEQAIIDTYETFNRVGRQRVAQAAADLVEEFPEVAAPFIERLPKRPDRMPADGRTVEAIIDGERRYYNVKDDDLFQSWTSFNKPTRSTLLKAAGGMRKFMQGGVTGHPVFGLVNGIRDFMVSGIQYKMRGGLAGQAAVGGAGAGTGAALAEPGERGEGALKGAALTLSARGAPHVAKHIGRSLSAMNDILGPDVLGAVIGGTSGAVSADEDESAFLRFLTGAGAGFAAGRGAGAAGLKGNAAVYKEFLRKGGGNFGFYATSMKDARAVRKQLLKEPGIQPSDFINPKSWWDAVQHVSRAIETAPRLAKYKEVTAPHRDAAGQLVGEAGERAAERGVFQGRDLSLDFGQRPGSTVLQMGTKTVPFLNPAIQGVDKLVRLMGDPNAVAVAASTILAPTVGLWYLQHADPEVASHLNDRPLYERNIYWLIPKKWYGGEASEFYRVPKPFEIGFIYASLPERLLDYAHTKDPEQVQFALRDMWGQYGPASVFSAPMPIGPAYEAFGRGEHGWDSFRGRPVNPYTYGNLPSELQYDERTSALGVEVGERTGMSPAKFDHLVRGYAGTLGGEVLDATTAAARKLGIDDRAAPAGRQMGVLQRLHTNPLSTTETELTFNRKWDRAEEAYSGVKALADRGDPERAREMATERRDDLLFYVQHRATRRQLNKLREARGKVYEADIPPEKKREAIAKINRAIAQIVRAGQGQEPPT